MVAETLSILGSSFEKKMEEKETSMLSLLLRRMHPGNCLSSPACGGDDAINDDNYVVFNACDRSETSKMDAIIPGLLLAIDIEMKSSPSQMNKDVLSAKTAALKNLYELSQSESNRYVKVYVFTLYESWTLVCLLIVLR